MCFRVDELFSFLKTNFLNDSPLMNKCLGPRLRHRGGRTFLHDPALRADSGDHHATEAEGTIFLQMPLHLRTDDSDPRRTFLHEYPLKNRHWGPSLETASETNERKTKIDPCPLRAEVNSTTATFTALERKKDGERIRLSLIHISEPTIPGYISYAVL